MTGSYASFLTLREQDRRDVLEAAASRLNTLPGYVEKDFWVCLVLDVLFNRRPDGHPKLLFKGGTALSKAFRLIERFSEDIDLVVFRSGLGFEGERDPTSGDLSNRKRAALFKELRAACSDYVCGELRAVLAGRTDEIAEGCNVLPDDADIDGQTLLIEYPTLYPSRAVPYVAPRVKIEAGARSALEPSRDCAVTPYIASELPDWSLDVGGIRVISPQRTYWEKLLILHGLYCGHRDAERLPADRDRISRHYYDVAMITATEVGRSALRDVDLLDSVRHHNMVSFRQAWKRFDEAVPGTVQVVPEGALRAVIERDYRAMQDMVLGDAPDFAWVLGQLQYAEAAINTT